MKCSLDYIGAREIARKSCLRSASFLGFGLNCARDERLSDFSLSKEVNLQFLPSDLPQGKIDEFKREFEKWIVSNGLRELIEGFAVFLDRMYEYSLLVTFNGKKFDPDIASNINKIRNKGLPGKQKALREDFGITCDFTPHLKSIYEARNCLSHTQGIVTKDHLNSGESLRISWRVLELVGTNSEGVEKVLDFLTESSPVEVQGEIRKRAITREKTYSIGQQISLSVRDLAEICMFCYLACDGFFFPALKHAKRHGLDDNNKKVEPDNVERGSCNSGEL